MTTLADIRTTVAERLRDTGNNTWSTDELDALINQGIDALADVYPKEIVQSLGTVQSSVYTYGASSFTNIYRIDLYDPDGNYRGPLPMGDASSRDAGWELHGGVVYLPPNLPLTADSTLEAFGYGRYVQLSASTSTTDLDTSGFWAVVAYCQARGFASLLADRVAFQQWQAQPGNTDVNAVGLAQIEGSTRSFWESEKQRLRRMRKR
jgi:hypothetical protein